ncbi:hypothetical protein [uncultured Ruthenibacterium sp.]|uniref:hypothetical protein n=1 Tax=uncultured Ruthenibacterium sp. TaxID=1905347 RepID=UPI00349E738A
MAVWKRLAALVATVALLTGCGGFPPGEDVEEMLRVPQATQQQSAVQKALTAAMGDTLQLKYPRGGDEMAPLLLDDFDADGETEALVFYTLKNKSQNVNFAVLEQQEGEWVVVQQVSGLSSELASVERVSFLQTGIQFVVGYANTNLADKYLAIYSYDGQQVSTLYTQAYDSYVVADFTGSGTPELVLIPTVAESGALSIQLAGVTNGKMELWHTVQMDERFTSCSSLMLSIYGNVRGLVVDGTFSSGAHASQVWRVMGKSLVECAGSNAEDIPRQSVRYITSLNSTDMSNNGLILVPQVLGSAAPDQLVNRLYYVQWNNYLAVDSALQFGIYDSEYSYYIRLPEAWRDTIEISLSTAQDDSWSVLDAQTQRILVNVRIVESPSTLPNSFVQGIRVGDKYVMFYFSGECSTLDAQIIQRGIRVIE